ncbi:MAG: hypothetical protein V2I33_05095 [Kangiellaceae bacterium]|jgi:hypothetical protein|nr:hypothetical protein [Kangiellaceae bacterium]
MSHNYREVLKKFLLNTLYQEQFSYWTRKLQLLQNENAKSHGRLIKNHSHVYAIFFNNKRWTADAIMENSQSTSAYCLPLNTKIPEFVTRMTEIAEELTELEEEQYEAERFISNLVTFDAPPERFKAILGVTLYRSAKEHINRAFNTKKDDWNLNNEYSLKTFVKQNQEIIQKINERVMINLVTL